MGFHNVSLPDGVSYGSGFGPGYNNFNFFLRSGAREVNQRQSRARRRFDLSYSNQSVPDVYELFEFFLTRGGSANTFRLKDWSDYATSATGATHRPNVDTAVSNTDIEIAAGDGSTTAFQLIKEYTSGGVTVSRTIQLPTSGTVTIAVGGVAQTETTDYTINYNTGIVTFNTAPALSASITAGFEFECKAFLDPEIDREFGAIIDAFDGSSIPNMACIEDLSDVLDPEINWNGGSNDFGTTTIDTTITQADGRALRFSPSSAHDVIFPSVLPIETGDSIFFIVNDGSQTLTLRYDDTTTSIGTVAAGARAEVWLVENGTSGLKEWELK